MFIAQILIYTAPLGAECKRCAKAHSAPLERTGIGVVRL